MKLRSRYLVIFSILLLILIITEVLLAVYFINTNQSIERIRQINYRTETIIKESLLIIIQINYDIWDSLFEDNDHSKINLDLLNRSALDFYSNISLLKELNTGYDDALKRMESYFQYYYQFASGFIQYGEGEHNENQNPLIGKFRENRQNLINVLKWIGESTSDDFNKELTSLNSSTLFSGFMILILCFCVIVISGLVAVFLSHIIIQPFQNILNIIASPEAFRTDGSGRNSEMRRISDRLAWLLKDMKATDESLAERKKSAMAAFRQKYQLTDREEEITNCLLEGYSNSEISKRLFLSINTIKNYIYNIYNKTGVKSRTRLINLVMEQEAGNSEPE